MIVACGIPLGSVYVFWLFSLFLIEARQTAEHLTLASLGKSRIDDKAGTSESGDRGNSTFREDESLPAPFRAKLQDYFRSGYDRGHMYVPRPRL